MSNNELRQNILNECRDYIRHLLIDMKRLNRSAIYPINDISEIIRPFIIDSLLKDHSDDRDSLTIERDFLASDLKTFFLTRIPTKIYVKNNQQNNISMYPEYSELWDLSSKYGRQTASASGYKEDVDKLVKDKCYVGALKKLAAMYELLLVIPSSDDTKSPQTVVFAEFNKKFSEIKQDLKVIRLSNPFIHKCTACFLEAIESLLHFFNPSLPYGSFFQSTGAKMIGRLEKLLATPEPVNTVPSWS